MRPRDDLALPQLQWRASRLPMGVILCAFVTSLAYHAAKAAEVEAPSPPAVTIEMMLDSLAALPGDIGPLPEESLTSDDPLAKLGESLFFDPRLSLDGSISCSSCHDPVLAFTDGRPLPRGVADSIGVRNAPTVLNSRYIESLFWDGRANSLEEQAAGPLLSPTEHGLRDDKHLENILAGIPTYQTQFESLFQSRPKKSYVAKAIAAFERTLVTPGSRFDLFIQGNREALTNEEKQGLLLFVGKASCTMCHTGPMFTDGLFHNLTGEMGEGASPDAGRFGITGDVADNGAFRTPSLRNAALTAPYFHDGRFETLEEVVAFYNRGGDENTQKSALIFPLDLSDQEQRDLVSFLYTLTGKLPEIKSPQNAAADSKSPPPADVEWESVRVQMKDLVDIRALMSEGFHGSLTFISYNLGRVGDLSEKGRTRVSDAARTLADLSARANDFTREQNWSNEERSHFENSLIRLANASRSTERAALVGPAAEVHRQFTRIETTCLECHERFRPDLIWTLTE